MRSVNVERVSRIMPPEFSFPEFSWRGELCWRLASAAGIALAAHNAGGHLAGTAKTFLVPKHAETHAQEGGNKGDKRDEEDFHEMAF